MESPLTSASGIKKAPQIIACTCNVGKKRVSSTFIRPIDELFSEGYLIEHSPHLTVTPCNQSEAIITPTSKENGIIFHKALAL